MSDSQNLFCQMVFVQMVFGQMVLSQMVLGQKVLGQKVLGQKVLGQKVLGQMVFGQMLAKRIRTSIVIKCLFQRHLWTTKHEDTSLQGKRIICTRWQHLTQLKARAFSSS
jgi:hypothetical protein